MCPVGRTGRFIGCEKQRFPIRMTGVTPYRNGPLRAKTRLMQNYLRFRFLDGQKHLPKCLNLRYFCSVHLRSNLSVGPKCKTAGKHLARRRQPYHPFRSRQSKDLLSAKLCNMAVFCSQARRNYPHQLLPSNRKRDFPCLSGKSALVVTTLFPRSRASSLATRSNSAVP